MLRVKSPYLTFSDGWGASWEVRDRRMTRCKQAVIHFREDTVGERRFWDAQVLGTDIDRAVLVPYASDIARGDIFLINGEQFEVVQRDRKDTKPESWKLSLKKAVVKYGT